jgi:hypothetical protein
MPPDLWMPVGGAPWANVNTAEDRTKTMMPTCCVRIVRTSVIQIVKDY